MPELNLVQLPTKLTLPCPLCGQDVTLPILWETESDETGKELSRYPLLDVDPDTVDHHGNCYCDYTEGFLQTWGMYLSEHGLEDLLSPSQAIQDLKEVIRLATSGLSLLHGEQFHLMVESIERLEEFFSLKIITPETKT